MKKSFAILLLALLLAGCKVISSFEPSATPEPTPAPPTPTPIPAAAVVNGVRIPLEDYSASLKQLQDAQAELGIKAAPAEQSRMVLDDLIGQELLAQAALEAGQELDDAALQSRIDALVEQVGGQDKLADWIIRMGYSDASFRSSLRRAELAAWQRDQITDAVPRTAEQVHARQILLRTEQTASELYAQLEAGADFATLAFTYDPLTGGDLGWFPRGYLFQPAVEEAAFALQPGQYSAVIQTSYGYHLVYVIERAEDRELPPDALLDRQRDAIRQWIGEHREAGSIEILLTGD